MSLFESDIKNLLQLSGLKESFKTYVHDNITDFRTKQEQFQEFQTKSIQESLDSVVIYLNFG
jgi:hypothetical protein